MAIIGYPALTLLAAHTYGPRCPVLEGLLNYRVIPSPPTRSYVVRKEKHHAAADLAINRRVHQLHLYHSLYRDSSTAEVPVNGQSQQWVSEEPR